MEIIHKKDLITFLNEIYTQHPDYVTEQLTTKVDKLAFVKYTYKVYTFILENLIEIFERCTYSGNKYTSYSPKSKYFEVFCEKEPELSEQIISENVFNGIITILYSGEFKDGKWVFCLEDHPSFKASDVNNMFLKIRARRQVGLGSFGKEDYLALQKKKKSKKSSQQMLPLSEKETLAPEKRDTTPKENKTPLSEKETLAPEKRDTTPKENKPSLSEKPTPKKEKAIANKMVDYSYEDVINAIDNLGKEFRKKEKRFNNMEFIQTLEDVNPGISKYILSFFLVKTPIPELIGIKNINTTYEF